MTDFRKDFKPTVPLEELFAKDSTPENTIAYYDARAATYDVDVAKVEYKGPEYAVENLVKNVPDKNASIISIGAGTGHEGQLLYDLGYTNLFAVDGAPKMVELCKQRGIFHESRCLIFHVGQKSELPDAHYDSLICVGTFFPGCLDERHMEELLRIVRPNGTLIIATQLKLVFPDPAPGVSYPYHLDKKIHKLDKDGVIKMIERNVYDDYGGTFGDNRGVVYVLKKN